MCTVQTSSVSTATYIGHHLLMVSFLGEMNYFATLGGLFSDGKFENLIKYVMIIIPCLYIWYSVCKDSTQTSVEKC